MLDVNEKEVVRRAVLVDEKSQRQVAKETGHSRNTIRNTLASGPLPIRRAYLIANDTYTCRRTSSWSG